MKIAIDARIINSSTGRYVERLLHYLQEIDQTNDYTILLRKKDAGFWRPTAKNFHVVIANFDNYSIEEQVGFAQLLYSLKADLVHFCMPQQPIAYLKPHVTTIHDLTLLKTYNSDKNWLSYHIKQLVGKAVFWVIARTSRHIITPSEYTKKEYITFSGIDPKKITVTYESADTAKNEPTPYVPLVDKSYLLYVGQQSDYKNIRRLMRTHQELKKSHPDLLLVLVGKISGTNGVSLQKNKQWAESQGFEGIIFTDFVSDEELAWLYQNTQAYVFPSLMEGFGLPGLEAMGYGAPVVSSNATCLPEIYEDAAYYFDPTNETAMQNAINEILTNTALRNELIVKGKRQSAKYSWRRMAEQTLSIYLKSI